MPTDGKCLIIKLGALGDVVMSTALLAAIRHHHGADSALTVLTTPAFAELFGRFGGVSVAAFERRGARAMLEVLRFIRRGRFNRIYDLQGNDRTQLLCALSGAPERVGNHNRYPYTHHPPDAWRGQTHIFERMRAVLACAGVDDVPDAPVLPAGPSERSAVERWLAARGLAAGRYAVLHAGASANRPDKRWPHFGALGERLAAEGLGVVWIGAAPDAALNRALAAQVGIDATGAFDVVALAELGRRARFAVTNDSGPMHVLSASGVPVFGLFGPSDWRRNHAIGQRERVIAADAVAGAGGVLRSVGVEVVLARLRDEALLAAA